ncbi:uncharacterized protein LOC132756220 [Ruditapes philippinarum]|uniref:uncharacterized protein LOC132756220 n=1 Tax=Ruditapes philippinarum TaxID=129788 RepID=UPI00295C233E|nr:uncharacterized protein LOC132756220 [Ruditapes philippinarum]
MASILLHVYDKENSEHSERLELYENELKNNLTMYSFTTYEANDKNQRHMPMLVIMDKRTEDLMDCFKSLDEDLIKNQYGGSVVIVVLCTDFNINFDKGNYTLVEDIVQVHFECNTLEPNGRLHLIGKDYAVERIRAVLDKIKVLIYDEEKGKSTKCFVAALEKCLPELRFKDFDRATDVEKAYFYIIAVLRQTSIRIEENINPLKMQLERKNVNPKKVIVTYFYMCKPDETFQDLKAERLYFANTVLMDFIDKDLEAGPFRLCPIWRVPKKINAVALQELKKSTQLENIRMEWFVDYIESNTPLINKFVEELSKSIPSSLPLRKVIDLKSVTSPTLVFCTVNQEQHEVKGDMGKVILFHIIDPDSGMNPQSGPCQQYGQTWKVYHSDGKFHVEMNFLKEFESFVRMCYRQM